MLLGWRIMRLLMINASMGPMVLMLNMMLFDVAVWLCVQIVFMFGVASAIYSLVGSPDVTSTGVHTDACELLWIADYQTRDGVHLERAPKGLGLCVRVWVGARGTRVECVRANGVQASMLRKRNATQRLVSKWLN